MSTTDDLVASLARELGARRRSQGVTSGLAVERAVMSWLHEDERGPGLSTDSACILVEAFVKRLNDDATPEQIGARMLLDFDAAVFAAYAKDAGLS